MSGMTSVTSEGSSTSSMSRHEFEDDIFDLEDLVL